MRSLVKVLGNTVLSFVVLFSSSLARGHEFHVSTVPDFQDALTQARSNLEDDVIYLAPGTYDVNQLNATLTYIASSGENFSLAIIGAGADNTILESSGNDTQVLHIETGMEGEWMPSAAITLRQFTVRHGDSNGKDGGGLFVLTHEADITMEDCVITRNKGYSGGGAFLKSERSGFVTVKRCRFTNNEGGGGDINGGGLFVQGRKVLIDQCQFLDNKAEGSAFDNRGAGLRAIGSDIRLTNSTFLRNEFIGDWGEYGAGAYLTGDGAFIRVANCVFTTNKTNDAFADQNEGALGVIGSEIRYTRTPFPIIRHLSIMEQRTLKEARSTSMTISFMETALAQLPGP